MILILKDPDWKDGWNEDSARDSCEIGISEMAALDLCQKYANIDTILYIGLCIEDIKVRSRYVTILFIMF